MARIKIELTAPPLDGMDVKFKAPCDCTEVIGLLVSYPAADGNTAEQEFTFRDCHGENLAGIGNLFAAGAYVKAILDTNRGHAYLQNADCNAYLNSAIFGTYTHDGVGLTGCGGNGKFKATESTTISAIKVNGVDCSVKCGEESSMDLIAGCWYTFILDGNTVNFNVGGAGGGLTFKVVGGTDAPASPSEGTIWVNTDTPITAYEFSATVPENPVEGMVWVETGVTSPVAFNALKKNGVIVYPISVQQHIGGVWVDQTVRSHQNGVWIDWWNGVYLFNEGDSCISATGGWVSVDTMSQNYATADGMATVGDTLTVATTNSTGDINRQSALATEKTIDVSGYDTMKIVVDSVTPGEFSGTRYCCFGLSSDRKEHTVAKEVTAAGELSMDISATSGSFYPFIQISNGERTMIVSKIWLE